MIHMKLICSLKLAAVASLMTLSTWAAALELKPFSASELTTLQQQGKPVVVHFHANWCPVCVGQLRSLESLKTDAELKDMTVLVADYDNEKALRKSLKVRSQSIMVAFKGDKEVARVNGQSSAYDIKAVLIKAL